MHKKNRLGTSRFFFVAFPAVFCFLPTPRPSIPLGWFRGARAAQKVAQTETQACAVKSILVGSLDWAKTKLGRLSLAHKCLLSCLTSEPRVAILHPSSLNLSDDLEGLEFFSGGPRRRFSTLKPNESRVTKPHIHKQNKNLLCA